MALKSWLASLKADVSNVSGVQAPIYADLGRYVTEPTDVSDVSGQSDMVISDTGNTAGTMLTYQAQPSRGLACTGDTGDTCKKTNADFQTTEAASTPNPTEPERLFRKHGPWLNGTEQWAAQAYHAHHFRCRTCISAGRGTRGGQRCSAGLALWNTYSRV